MFEPVGSSDDLALSHGFESPYDSMQTLGLGLTAKGKDRFGARSLRGAGIE